MHFAQTDQFCKYICTLHAFILLHVIADGAADSTCTDGDEDHAGSDVAPMAALNRPGI